MASSTDTGSPLASGTIRSAPSSMRSRTVVRAAPATACRRVHELGPPYVIPPGWWVVGPMRVHLRAAGGVRRGSVAGPGATTELEPRCPAAVRPDRRDPWCADDDEIRCHIVREAAQGPAPGPSRRGRDRAAGPAARGRGSPRPRRRAPRRARWPNAGPPARSAEPSTPTTIRVPSMPSASPAAYGDAEVEGPMPAHHLHGDGFSGPGSSAHGRSGDR